MGAGGKWFRRAFRAAHTTRSTRLAQNRWEQGLLELFEGPGAYGFDGEGIGDMEIPAGGSAKGRHDSTAAELVSNIRAKCTDISAFGAVDAERGIGEIDREELEGEHGDGAWLALDGDALARQFVEWFAVLLDGGDHGGDLLLYAKHALNSLCQ